jgi:NADH dehydrogenase
MRVFVTGGTGFVGGHMVSGLMEAGHDPLVLVRQDSGHGLDYLPDDVISVQGDVFDQDLEKSMEGAEAVIHLVGVIRAYPSKGITFDRLHTEATKNVVRAMKNAGVKRLAHMSALGAGPDGPTGYFRTKWEAEEAVKESGLDFTVFKPSVIFGPRDEFVVGNVADGFIKALTMDETIGKTYEVGGPEELTYNDILDQIARALGRKAARNVHLPLALMKPMIRLMQNLPLFPVTMDQLTMLLMNNTCDSRPYFDTFGIEPVEFGEGIRQYL